jgi:molecular chaperone HtpG
VDEHEYSPMLERALKKSGAGAPPEHKRVMELNPKHPLIERMKQRQSASTDDSLLNNAAEVLLGLSLLAEGSELPDAARFNRAATEVLGQVM